MPETARRALPVGKGGLYGDGVRISPALNVTAADVDEAIRILKESFAAMAG